MTLLETVLAFGIGTVLGLVFGLWLALAPTASAILDPYIKAANSMPRVILAPIFALWFGLGMWSKVALGTDYAGYTTPFQLGMPVHEMEYMQATGMTPRTPLATFQPETHPRILLSDTVGFIDRLPQDLFCLNHFALNHFVVDPEPGLYCQFCNCEGLVPFKTPACAAWGMDLDITRAWRVYCLLNFLHEVSGIGNGCGRNVGSAMGRQDLGHVLLGTFITE